MVACMVVTVMLLQERDLAVPLHIDACQKLLAHSTSALNNSFSPF